MTRIVFPQGHDYTGDNFDKNKIKFPALVDGKQTDCLITKEQLKELFELRSEFDFEAEFIAHRPEIQIWAVDEIRKKLDYNKAD